jgi:hypothetical protein
MKKKKEHHMLEASTTHLTIANIITYLIPELTAGAHTTYQLVEITEVMF